jgi:hypothetical protein
MRKLEVLKSLLVQDRLIKFNLDLLEGLLREIRADIEEIKILVESCLEEEERESLLKTLADFEANFKNLIVQALDYIYDLYELFNFDITFLSNIPEELGREIERQIGMREQKLYSHPFGFTGRFWNMVWLLIKGWQGELMYSEAFHKPF